MLVDNEKIEIEKKELLDLLRSFAIFTTAQEHLRHWDEYKQDAENRLNEFLRKFEK